MSQLEFLVSFPDGVTLVLFCCACLHHEHPLQSFSEVQKGKEHLPSVRPRFRARSSPHVSKDGSTSQIPQEWSPICLRLWTMAPLNAVGDFSSAPSPTLNVEMIITLVPSSSVPAHLSVCPQNAFCVVFSAMDSSWNSAWFSLNTMYSLKCTCRWHGGRFSGRD